MAFGKKNPMKGSGDPKKVKKAQKAAAITFGDSKKKK